MMLPADEMAYLDRRCGTQEVRYTGISHSSSVVICDEMSHADDFCDESADDGVVDLECA